MSTIKEKVIAGVMIATAGVSGNLLAPKTEQKQINLLDFSQVQSCTEQVSLTGNFLTQDKPGWQIIFTNTPSTLPCKIGPISAIRPKVSKDSGLDPLTTISTKVYLYMNDEDSPSQTIKGKVE